MPGPNLGRSHLPLEHLARMPIEELAIGLTRLASKNRDLRATQAVVAVAIIELVAKTLADAEDVVRRDGYVTEIEEPVQIAAEQQACPAIAPTNSADLFDHRRKVWSTVHLAEAVPREPCGQALESFEEPKPGNRLERSPTR